ncbi:gfo/Idh/MocA family oxidoreductase [Verminephrobacter aporrectodeae subsp. tuberculatae]|nr:gfo/Idh/MocA family oxidoreductase [Verminephrobacter aporrectodeae subsp. tuberculatae]MCW5290712.1 gfo/Idh/MocA family oxidoreductase [Verminephrobacter aporrectodeae subsp. tuberculatae]MCW8175395.1 gfo/Idh/MocA family oxidoreductase [Verminephrobacter aporrectodeae subsp. tuberculatae]MCW8203340.1 gfo/Idh/MocA family oxidoreductase [Verminephrobacter aporrectodeae subsp. tuberculatae]
MMKPSSGPTSMSAASPRILCISLGSIGRRHLRNARALLPRARIAVWRQHRPADGSVPEGADEVATSLQQALDFMPDAVLVSSPASAHVANARPFVQRNLPVFLEKPLAARGQDLGDFPALCRASSGFTMVGYVLRFLPVLQAIRQALHDGLPGQVHTARAEVGQYLPDWRPGSDYRQGVSGQDKLGGGALLELSHEIDYATWLFGWPQSLQCSRARLSPLDIDVEDSAHLLLEYADKRLSLQLDLLQRVAHMALQIVGSKGTLVADLIRQELRFIDPANPQGRSIEAPKLPDGNGIYLRQFDFFFSKALADYRPMDPRTSGFDSWADVGSAQKVLHLVDLAKQASDTGLRQTVTFAQNP